LCLLCWHAANAIQSVGKVVEQVDEKVSKDVYALEVSCSSVSLGPCSPNKATIVPIVAIVPIEKSD
jgi:hypothetical protein